MLHYIPQRITLISYTGCCEFIFFDIMTSFIGVGLMSGSSLDGLDLCCAEFTGDKGTDIWTYRILEAKTIEYSKDWRQKLQDAMTLSGLDLMKLNVEYGTFLGDTVADFISSLDVKVDFVTSHGHTVFHLPDKSFTCQIGDGETMAAKLNCPLVTNLRNKDVALGGQGAPLVPSGEPFLFCQYDLCLNLGGISNLSMLNRNGFDVSPCNMLLNYLIQLHDSSMEYDKDGNVSRTGSVVTEMLDTLNILGFYKQKPPRTLGREWFRDSVIPIIEKYKGHGPANLLRTAVEHIAHQTTCAIKDMLQNDRGTPFSLLATGGGALNTFLMERISTLIEEANLNVTIVETDEETIQYKEALVFAFLGLRCMMGMSNVLSAVTGARQDSVCGSIHLPPHVDSRLAHNEDFTFHFKRLDSRA